MLRRIVDSFGSIGLAALLAGYFYYSVNNLWDWRTQAAIYGGAALVVIYLATNGKRFWKVLTSRSGRYGSAALFSVVLVIGILALANFLNFRYHKRVDLTEGQIFALSDQSRRIVGHLTQPVEVIGFFQEDAAARRFQELLREYRYHSSLLSFEVVDPQMDPGKVKEFDIRRDGQVVVVRSDRREVVDDFNEERLTNALIRVTRAGETVVYFLEGHGEKDFMDDGAQGYSLAREGVERQNYVARSLNLAMEGAVPEDADLLISAGPRVGFLPNEVELLEQYLAKGGRFLLMVDPQTDFEMNDFLSQYGLHLMDNVVIDTSGVGRFFGMGPAVPLVTDYSDHPITREVRQLMTFFPLARGIAVNSSPLSYETQWLLRSSPRSFGETELVGQEASFDEGKDHPGPLDLAAAASKVLRNRGDAGDGGGNDEAASGDGEDSEAREARIVLFGDSDFAANAYFRSAGNGDLFMNTVSWLVEDEDLISIRPRDPADRRVTLSASQARLIFWGTVILLPLATLLYGASIWYRRR